MLALGPVADWLRVCARHELSINKHLYGRPTAPR